MTVATRRRLSRPSLQFTRAQVERTDAMLEALAKRGNPFASLALTQMADTSDTSQRASTTAVYHAAASVFVRTLELAAQSPEGLVTALATISRIKPLPDI